MVTAKSEKAHILTVCAFFVSSNKGLKKMIKTLKHSIKNPLDTLFNAFINDKINKNVLPYNGIYKLMQAHR